MSLWKKFLKLEKRVFSAPYKWSVKKGIIPRYNCKKNLPLNG